MYDSLASAPRHHLLSVDCPPETLQLKGRIRACSKCSGGGAGREVGSIHGFRCSSICTCFRWESPLYLEEFGVGKYEIRELGTSAPLAVVEKRIRIPQLVGSSVCHIPILSISFTYCLSHMQFGIWPELIGRFVCFYTGVTRLSHSPLPQDTAPGHESLPFQFFLTTSQEC